MASSIPASAPTDAAFLPAARWRLRVHGRRVPTLAVVGVAFVVLLALVAIFAPWLAPRIRSGSRSAVASPRRPSMDLMGARICSAPTTSVATCSHG